ncbi:hypothetical protein A0G02_13345 [Pectobacterium peruviense]|uniref:Uncharacterized protein n=1 Tax=Pectobacterium peruviense TaxID=2066479 RepID=A0ABX4SAP0_9GAMM|nr:hypothetical protein A0G02_13345 [Pectobacterium peruviense]PKX87116.1 hypothetical protein A0G03_06615 [Pectobacterium peruviense]
MRQDEKACSEKYKINTLIFKSFKNKSTRHFWPKTKYNRVMIILTMWLLFERHSHDFFVKPWRYRTNSCRYKKLMSL